MTGFTNRLPFKNQRKTGSYRSIVTGTHDYSRSFPTGMHPGPPDAV